MAKCGAGELKLSAEDRAAVQALYCALARMRAATSPWVSMQLLHAFVLVAREEGQSLTEIAVELGARPSTASRQLLDLASFKRDGQPGFGLVEVRKDPLDPCANCYVLTAKGRLLREELLAGF